MTSSAAGTTPQRRGPGIPRSAYVWAWLPGSTTPVVAGAVQPLGGVLHHEAVLGFAYARTYLARPDAITLFIPELPLRRGTIDPTDATPGPAPDPGPTQPGPRSPRSLAGCLRDACPDSWGRRVINTRFARNPDVEYDELTYMLASGSNRIGALDFQESATRYVPRGEEASLEQLLAAAELIEQGVELPEDLVAAAEHGTAIGGARPKALLEAGNRHLIAKFSSSTDVRPVVKAEAVAMLLAASVGLNVAPVEVVRSAGKDVLLVERFDRTPAGARLPVLSALTVLGLHDAEARYASYADLAHSIRYPGWTDVSATLTELFTRLVFNIAVSNNDDHLRNHAAFWDGRLLTLTPAYDVCPSPRSTSVSTQAIGITRATASTPSQNASQFRVCRDVAGEFLLSRAEADAIIDHVVSTIRIRWNDACDEATLTSAERAQFMGREILHDYVFWDAP